MPVEGIGEGQLDEGSGEGQPSDGSGEGEPSDGAGEGQGIMICVAPALSGADSMMSPLGALGDLLLAGLAAAMLSRRGGRRIRARTIRTEIEGKEQD